MAKPHFEEMMDKFLYSDQEVQVGWYEKNGVRKPLYRKVCEYNSNIASGWSGISFSTLGISNVEFLRIPSALGKSPSGNVWEEMTSNQNRIQINLDNSTLSLYLTDGALSKIKFVLEYTKTTD